MPTPRQEKLAEAIIENASLDKPETLGVVLEKVGYAPTTAGARPGEVIEAKGVQEALEDRGFTLDNAKKVVSEIMLNQGAKDRDRLTAADMTIKVHGGYAPEKKITLNAEIGLEDFAKYADLNTKFDEEMKRKSLE